VRRRVLTAAYDVAATLGRAEGVPMKTVPFMYGSVLSFHLSPLIIIFHPGWPSAEIFAPESDANVSV